MARGIKPIIHHFKGAEQLFPSDLLFRTMDGFLETVKSTSYNSGNYRSHVRNHYALEDQIDRIHTLLTNVAASPSLRASASEDADVSDGSLTRQTDSSPPNSSNWAEFISPVSPIIRNSQTKKHLFIVGQPRSGTTITWKTIRQDPRWRCYNEPFNLHLRELVESGVDHPKETMGEYLEIPDLFRKHWSPILPYAELYDRFLSHQTSFLQVLCETADRVCIDFTHVNARIAHLKEIVPEALIVHLVRDPRAWVTSHLRPYGKWLPGLPESFFNYQRSFNYWCRQEVARQLDAEGFAHEQLLQVWNHLTSRAEADQPDVTLSFEWFAKQPEKALETLYQLVGMDYDDTLDVSDVHLPNAPYRPGSPEWGKALDEKVSKVGRRFVCSAAKLSEKKQANGTPARTPSETRKPSLNHSLHRPDKTVIVTGIPRSGTSLFSTLVNQLPNSVCLNEILYDVDKLPKHIAEVRRRLLAHEPIPNKYNDDGSLTTNTQESQNLETHLVDKRVGSDVVIGTKVNVPYLIQLNKLMRYGFKVVAVVRNPIYTIASWRSEKSKNIPEAQVSDHNLNPRWANFPFSTESPIERQAEIWQYLAQIMITSNGNVNIYKYENIIENTIDLLNRFSSLMGIEWDSSLALDFELKNMNLDSRYQEIDEIRKAVEEFCPAAAELGYDVVSVRSS